jgi:Tol biopolymer transport system component
VHDTDYSKASLWVMNADGSDPRVLRAVGRDGWQLQGHPEWSPDGTQLVVFGGSGPSSQIFIVDASSGAIVRQLTDRPGMNLDPSWGAADAANVLFIGCPSAVCFETNFEVYRVSATGGMPTRLTTNTFRDHDPYLTRQGTAIYWSQQIDTLPNGGAGVWSLLMMQPDGASPTRVTMDGAINGLCQFPIRDEQPIYFHRVAAPANHFGIYRADPTGGALAPVLVDGFNNEFPSF